jgi:hypothetical protein
MGPSKTDRLYNLYTSSNIVGVSESERMRWVGIVAGLDEMRNTYKILASKLQRKINWMRRMGEQN